MKILDTGFDAGWLFVIASGIAALFFLNQVRKDHAHKKDGHREPIRTQRAKSA